MSTNNIDIRWVGIYKPQMKVWGWYIDSNKFQSNQRSNWGIKDCFCFWAICGKTININKHLYIPYSMQKLVNKKISNSYVHIEPIDEFIKLWPTFYQDLSNRIVFKTLSGEL